MQTGWDLWMVCPGTNALKPYFDQSLNCQTECDILVDQNGQVFVDPSEVERVRMVNSTSSSFVRRVGLRKLPQPPMRLISI
jgi:hypothetical protein